jgi:hypothetical protein
MEEPNLLGLGEHGNPSSETMAVPLVEPSPSADPGESAISQAATKAAAVVDAVGAQSPVSADSLIDDASASESAVRAAAASASGKPQRKYERKTKRFVWPDELHRLFVASIFDCAL